jgi:hypothetical protein
MMAEPRSGRTDGVLLVRKGGTLRSLLWPYFVLDQVLFAAILMSVLTFLVLRSGFEAPIVMIGPAYLGIHTVAFITSPAHFVARRLNLDDARLCLGRLGYRREADVEPEVWLPPLPRWLIWSNSGVKLEFTDEGVRVSGPHPLLDLLLNNLKAHGYV